MYAFNDYDLNYYYKYVVVVSIDYSLRCTLEMHAS